MTYLSWGGRGAHSHRAIVRTVCQWGWYGIADLFTFTRYSGYWDRGDISPVMSKIHSDTILPERPSGLSQILSISSFPLFFAILRRWAFDWPLVAEMLCGISRLLHFHFSGPCVLNSFHLDICPQCTQGRDLNSKSTTMLSFKPSWEGQTAWHAPVLVHLRC